MMSAGAWAEPMPDYGFIVQLTAEKVKRFCNKKRKAAERRFVGEDRFGQAFDAITDYLCRLAVVLVPVEWERLVDMQEYDEQIFALVTAIATDGK